MSTSTTCMLAPRLLNSVADLTPLIAHAPSVIFDLTQLGAIRSHDYHHMWPQALIYAYPHASAVESEYLPLPAPLGDSLNWGARVSASHGVLADIRLHHPVPEGSSDSPPQLTIDIVSDEHQLKQISLLILPASYRVLSTLLGASHLLASADILAVVIFDQPDREAPAELLVEIAGMLAKFGYRWVSIDGTAVSVAASDRAEGTLLSRNPKRAGLPWLEVARDFHIPLNGVIHIGESEPWELDLYRSEGVGKIVVVGPDAQTYQRLNARTSNTTDIIYVNASIGESSGAAAWRCDIDTLEQLATRYDLRQCNVLHLELDAEGLTGIARAPRLLRHVDLINVELKRTAAGIDRVDLADLDACLRQCGLIRISMTASIYPGRDAAVYVRTAALWTHDPMKAAGIALQIADASMCRVASMAATARDRASSESPGPEGPTLLYVMPPRIGHNRCPTQMVRLHQQAAMESFGEQVEVTYILQDLETTEQPAELDADEAPLDVDVLVLSDASLETFHNALRRARNSRRLSAIAWLSGLSDKDLESAILCAFDQGFLIDRSTAASTGRIFVRSELIREPGRWLRQNNTYGNRHFGFSLLGKIGRFGNQLFQLWHLILNGLRHNAIVSTGKWDFREYFGLEFLEKEGAGEFFGIKPYDWRVMGIWAMESLPDGIDFYAHFQWIPPFLQRHRVFLSRLFDPQPECAPAVCKVIASLRSSGRPLSVFHVRRTDYVNHVSPEMREIPTSWYKAALEKLGDTTIYAASDDIDYVRRAFPEFAIVSCEDFAECGLPSVIIDHCVMRAADTLLVVNSSYSRTAAMIARDHQTALLPSIHLGAFESYAPWSDPVFWLRFKCTDPEEYSKRVAEVQDWLRSAGLAE